MRRLFLVLLTLAAAVLALLALRSFWLQHHQAAGLDFYIYFVNAQLASRQDVANIYAPETQDRIGEEYYERAQRSGSELRKYDANRRRRLDNVSSPFLYTTLRWVSRDYDFALRQYHLLVLIAFLAGIALLCRRVNVSWASTLLLIAGLLQFYRGFEADFRVGNVNSLQLLMLAVALWSRSILAGAIIGMLICFKPNLVLVAVLLMVSRVASGETKRLRREIFGGIIGALIAFFTAAVSYGTWHVWLQWIAAANEFYHRIPTAAERNVTPALWLFQHLGAWPSYVIAAVLTTVAAVAIWRRKQQDDVLIAGVGVIIYLLSATVVWLHYMVLALPLAIALMRRRTTAAISVAALALIAEEPFELLTHTPVYPHDAWLIGPGLAALYACGIWMIAKSEGDPAAA